MFMHLQQKYKKRQNKPTVKRDTRGDVQKNTWCHTRVFLQFLRAGFTPELHGYVFKAAVSDNVLFPLLLSPHRLLCMAELDSFSALLVALETRTRIWKRSRNGNKSLSAGATNVHKQSAESLLVEVSSLWKACPPEGQGPSADTVRCQGNRRATQSVVVNRVC